MTRLKQYAELMGAKTVTQIMSEDEKKAAGLIPVRLKAAPTAQGGGQRPGAAPVGGARPDPADASRQQYNAMEMRGFADGKRSVLDIRNALSAEYGPQPIEKVLAFFEGAVKTGEFELTRAAR